MDLKFEIGESQSFDIFNVQVTLFFVVENKLIKLFLLQFIKLHSN